MTGHVAMSGQEALALRRWKLGHQAFNFILEGMIAQSQACRAALRSGDHDALLEGLKSLAFLYRAATAAFRYAAEFAPHLYADVVRPSMMPPNLPEGFSGTLNLKHGLMKQTLQGLLKELVPVVDAPGQETLKWAVRDLLNEKAENLRNHGLVCARFVPGGRSLLRDFYDRKRKEARKDDSGL